MMGNFQKLQHGEMSHNVGEQLSPLAVLVLLNANILVFI